MSVNNINSLAVMALSSFMGGAMMMFLMNAGTSFARDANSYFNVSDSLNARGVETYVDQGNAVQNIYAADGKIRLQMGTYNRPGEAGLPLMGMSDNKGNLRMLLRLAGPNEAPVIIMKDNSHRDRVVMGLALGDEGEEPFLAVFDRNGKKKMIFGEYR